MIPKAGEIETRLRDHCGDGAVYEVKRIIHDLAVHFKLTKEDLAETDGSHLRFEHKVHSALARHKRLGLLARAEWGSFRYLPENLSKYKPRHHLPRARDVPPSPHQKTSVAEALRQLKRKRHALTLAIRELEQGFK
jgi:hypothetical protein